jgi:hypothetical protein
VIIRPAGVQHQNRVLLLLLSIRLTVSAYPAWQQYFCPFNTTLCILTHSDAYFLKRVNPSMEMGTIIYLTAHSPICRIDFPTCTLYV